MADLLGLLFKKGSIAIFTRAPYLFGMPKKDDGFRDFIVSDQLGELGVECRAMFGGYGLYYREHFFGIISQSRLYFKTDAATRIKYIEARSAPFRPNPRQTLRNYYEVPPDIIENSRELSAWALEASQLA